MPAPKGNKNAVGNKGGAPFKPIDYEAVEKLASIMATQEEIASYLDLSVSKLQKDVEFIRVYKKGLEKGKMSLRRKQYSMSETNPTMAIWLGKQYLGQRDKQEIEHSGGMGLTWNETKTYETIPPVETGKKAEKKQTVKKKPEKKK